MSRKAKTRSKKSTQAFLQSLDFSLNYTGFGVYSLEIANLFKYHLLAECDFL